jgi:hypothetical protein
MWLFNKIFFKLYFQAENTMIFTEIVALQNYDYEELLYILEDLDRKGYSFIPTTAEAYLEFKMYQDTGDISKYNDLQTENIRC